MSRTMTAPYNIRNYAAALAEGLSYGDRIHLVVCGYHRSDDAFFVQFHNHHDAIIVAMGSVTGKRLYPIFWGEIIELWPLEEKPDIYHSDMSDVAEKLIQLKSAVQKHVQANDGAGVLYLLDEVARLKKAELLINQTRDEIVGIGC